MFHPSFKTSSFPLHFQSSKQRLIQGSPKTSSNAFFKYHLKMGPSSSSITGTTDIISNFLDSHRVVIWQTLSDDKRGQIEDESTAVQTD